jgi:hypothetical protein
LNVNPLGCHSGTFAPCLLTDAPTLHVFERGSFNLAIPEGRAVTSVLGAQDRVTVAGEGSWKTAHR